jgi:hypothetical protein
MLVGLLILALAGTVLLAARRRAPSAAGAGSQHPPRVVAVGEQR